MPNLYLFRNALTQKVLVSSKFRMNPSILNQIGEHRPQLGIRPDHWVPFAVLTGLRDTNVSEGIARQITRRFKHPLGYYTLPLPRKEQFPGWTISDEIRDKTIKLCEALNAADIGDISIDSGRGNGNKSEVKAEESEITTNDKSNEVQELMPLDNSTLCIHWERDEFRRIVEQKGIAWPSQVSHKKLRLIKNRYPVVPEFSNKHRDDEYVLREAVKPERKSKLPQLKRRKLYDTIETSQYSNKSWKRKTMKPERQIPKLQKCAE